MSLKPDSDFVICPKVNLMVKSGICTGVAIATKTKIFIIPDNTFGGGGLTTTKTTYSIGGKAPLAALEDWLKEPDFTIGEIEKRLSKIFKDDWKLEDPNFTIDVNTLSEFKIKAGFFNKAVYYKRQGEFGWRTVAVSGKDRAIALQNFYPQAVR